MSIPDVGQILSCLQCLEPYRQAKNHREKAADDGQVPMELQPSSGRRQHHSGYGDHESDKVKYRIRNRRCMTVSILMEKGVSKSLPFNGHIFNNISVVTFLRVGVDLSSACVTRAKINSRPPETTKRRSTMTYVRKILSCAILMVLCLAARKSDSKSTSPTMTTGV